MGCRPAWVGQPRQGRKSDSPRREPWVADPLGLVSPGRGGRAIAHGVSRGLQVCPAMAAPGGAKERLGRPASHVTIGLPRHELLSPLPGLRAPRTTAPRLAPWATALSPRLGLVACRVEDPTWRLAWRGGPSHERSAEMGNSNSFCLALGIEFVGIRVPQLDAHQGRANEMGHPASYSASSSGIRL